MSYDFENIKINENITTFSVFQVEKMPDQFLEVEFCYTRCPSWRTCVPIYEKYQGIDMTNSSLEDVIDWIKQCYDEMNPVGYKIWKENALMYWEGRTRAEQAKTLFQAIDYEDRYHLTNWACRQCTDTSRVNSQAASRIRALKETHGYHIASKDMYCDVCHTTTKHDLLLRLTRTVGTSKKRNGMPKSIVKRTKEIFDYTDACFGEKMSKSTKTLVVDHKFPATRWANGESPNYAGMTDEEIIKKFQLLTNQTNLQKDRYCVRCYDQKIRGDFFGIKWYPEGDENWNGTNNSDENGCKGCPWYDLLEWKEKFNEYLKEKP